MLNLFKLNPLWAIIFGFLIFKFVYKATFGNFPHLIIVLCIQSHHKVLQDGIQVSLKEITINML